jgi:drug/metabolite transporter (DMT)-like permease
LLSFLFGGWRVTPVRYLLAGCLSYASYYLILTAYGLGGDVVAVNCLRQVSIPLSVLLGGLFLREINISSRFSWSLLLVAGIVIIITAK